MNLTNLPKLMRHGVELAGCEPVASMVTSQHSPNNYIPHMNGVPNLTT